MPLAPKTQLARYEIRSLLGAGGMGEVYLAQDTSLNRRVALKVLPPEVASNHDRMRRFKQEASAAASLNHPSIAHVYEIGEFDGLHFIAMEYVEGVTLRTKIHEEAAELSKLLRVLQHVAEGLAKAHDAGIVHRDLKPDNVMITSDGHGKVLDFGLAKLLEPQPASGSVSSEEPTILQHSTPGVILGTAGYMSPEQAQGKTKEIDHRADIFSFGCILFEAITAVIPFVNQAKDPGADWISDGLTESIINNLAQLPNLKVIARSSVFRYKGREDDPVAIGKELGVRAVLAGRLMQRGDSMVISAELTDIRDNKQLWGEQYERRLADMLSVQREIAREITSNLRPTLSGVDRSRMDKQYTANPEAYQLYLKGRFYWNKRTAADFQKAITYFEQAIEKDPNYALAYSGLADSYTLLTVYSSEPPRELMPKAKKAALTALELDDKLAEAQASYGQIVVYYDYELSTAERQYRRAIELNPNYATAHQWLAEHLATLKRFDEAIAEIKRALDLDPLSVIMNRIYGDILMSARRFDEAIEQYKKTAELDPNFPTTQYFLGRACEAKGMYDKATSQYTIAGRLSGLPPEILATANEVYAKSGWKAYLQASLEQILKQPAGRRFPPFVIATYYGRLGQADECIAWLERGYEERDFRLTVIGVAWEFDSVRSDPRFVELVRKIGLPQ